MEAEKVIRLLRRLPWEAFVWLLGLTILGFTYPSADNHFTICPFALSGFDWCPGCGLGRSVSYLFHGEFQASFSSHPFGLIAVVVLSFRIINLTKQFIDHGQNY